MKKTVSLIIITAYLLTSFTFSAFASNNEITEQDLEDLFLETIEQNETVNQAQEAQDRQETKAEPCDATLDDVFASDSVLITLTREQSRIRDQYTPADFPQIDASSVETIFNYYPDSDNRVILEIALNNSDKQKVLDTVDSLYQLDFVYTAEPNYIFEMATYEDEVIQGDNSDVMQRSGTVYTGNQLRLESDANQAVASCCAKKYVDPSKNNIVKVGFVGYPILQSSEAGAKTVKWFDCVTNQELYVTPTGNFLHTTQVANVMAREQVDDMYNPHPVSECGYNTCSGTFTNVDIYSFNIHPLGRGYNNNNPDYSYFVNAFNLAKQNGVKILSFSELFYNKENKNTRYVTFENAVTDYDGIIITSASNYSNGLFTYLNIDDSSEKIYPTICVNDNVIVVGECEYNDDVEIMPALSSCYGPTTVDLFAHGYTFNTVAGDYKSLSGTSFATPRVTGAAALLWSINENLTVAQIKHYIMAGVDKSQYLTGFCVSGGSLNIYKSAKMVIADMAYDGKSIFTGHFTRTDKIQVAAITRGAYNAAKIYVWTYNKKPGTFSDPEHLKTNFSYALDNDWGRNKFRIVCGDFDGNGFDEFCTLYDYDDYLFIEGKDYICHPGYIPVPVEGFTGKVAALDYDEDGSDEVVGFYGISEGVTDLYVWDFNGSGASMSASLTYQYRIPTYFNAFNVDYKVVAGNFVDDENDYNDNDENEELAALYRSSVTNDQNHYYLILIDFTEDGVVYDEPFQANMFDVNTFWGRIVSCNYDGVGTDEIVFLYDNPNAHPDGIINYGVIFNSVGEYWSVENLYESGAYEFNADISTDLMSAGDYNGDGYDEVLAVYKLPAANPTNVRTRIYWSQHEIRNGEHKLTGYFCKWDPRGQY